MKSFSTFFCLIEGLGSLQPDQQRKTFFRVWVFQDLHFFKKILVAEPGRGRKQKLMAFKTHDAQRIPRQSSSVSKGKIGQLSCFCLRITREEVRCHVNRFLVSSQSFGQDFFEIGQTKLIALQTLHQRRVDVGQFFIEFAICLSNLLRHSRGFFSGKDAGANCQKTDGPRGCSNKPAWNCHASILPKSPSRVCDHLTGSRGKDGREWSN